MYSAPPEREGQILAVAVGWPPFPFRRVEETGEGGFFFDVVAVVVAGRRHADRDAIIEHRVAADAEVPGKRRG